MTRKLRLRTQVTSYIPSHLHLNNNHTHTPYDQRYCPSCLPIQIVGNEPHTLLHCPHSSHLSHPAILALPALFVDLISVPGPHTPRSNKLRFSLGPGPLNSFKNTTKHGLTLPLLRALSLQSHFSKHLSSRSTAPVTSLISSLVNLPSDDTKFCCAKSL